MDCKIINGTIVTATDKYRADVGIARGKIVQIAKKIKEKEELYIPQAVELEDIADLLMKYQTKGYRISE